MRVQDISLEVTQLEESFKDITDRLLAVANRLQNLNEAITVPVNGDLNQQLTELQKRFDAARRGLSLVNKLAPGPEKTSHARRVLGNLNTIRAMLGRVTAQVEQFEKAEKDFESGSGYESEERWAGNTLDSIIKNKERGEFCPNCKTNPCCCEHEDEEWCPECDGYGHKEGVSHEEQEGSDDLAYVGHMDREDERNQDPRFAAAQKAARASKELKHWNLGNPFEQEEEEGKKPGWLKAAEIRAEKKEGSFPGEEDEESCCPDCGKNPCTCRFTRLKDAIRNIEKFGHQEEEEAVAVVEVCDECGEDPCECCNFCKKASCVC